MSEEEPKTIQCPVIIYSANLTLRGTRDGFFDSVLTLQT